MALGHEVVGVWTPPDNGRPDPLAALAEERGWPLFRRRAYRRNGTPIPACVEEHRALEPDLNVLPFMTSILPPDIVDYPRHGTICFHPSLLPAYRGGAALSWQIILGAEESGVSVFRVTNHVDHGPLLLRRDGVKIEPHDTMASLYFDKLYPLGVEAMVDAVEAIASGTARPTPQPNAGSSEQGLVDDSVARIDWNRPAVEVDRLIRGCDPAPGSLTFRDGEAVRLYGGGLAGGEPGAQPPGTVLAVGAEGLVIATAQGAVRVAKVRRGQGAKVAADESGLAAGDTLT